MQDKPKYSLKEEAKKYSYNFFVNKPDMRVTNIIDGIDYKSNNITRKNIIGDAIKNVKSIGRIDNNGNVVVYVDTDVVVEISPAGIDETLSYGNRFQTVPRKMKEAKIATIRSLPKMIKFAEIKELKQRNYHGNQSKFLVLTHPAIVDGMTYDVEIKIKKTSKNKFYIHNLTLKKEIDTPTGEVTINTVSTPIISSNLSPNDNISQSDTSVNSNSMQDETKNSLKKQPIDYNAVLKENEELSEMNEALKQMLELASAENKKLKNEFKITDRHNSKRHRGYNR